jgi:transposase
MALIELNSKDFISLQKLLTTSADARQLQRAQALLWLDEGDGIIEEVAARLRVSRQTVYNWLTRFVAHADLPVESRVTDSARSGRPATALGVIDPLIEEVIDTDPRSLDYRSTIWTASLLQQYLTDHHQIEVSIKSISRALARLEIRWKRPRHNLARRGWFWRQAKGGLKRASGAARAR